MLTAPDKDDCNVNGKKDLEIIGNVYFCSFVELQIIGNRILGNERIDHYH